MVNTILKHVLTLISPFGLAAVSQTNPHLTFFGSEKTPLSAELTRGKEYLFEFQLARPIQRAVLMNALEAMGLSNVLLEVNQPSIVGATYTFKTVPKSFLNTKPIAPAPAPMPRPKAPPPKSTAFDLSKFSFVRNWTKGPAATPAPAKSPDAQPVAPAAAPPQSVQSAASPAPAADQASAPTAQPAGASPGPATSYESDYSNDSDSQDQDDGSSPTTDQDQDDNSSSATDQDQVVDQNAASADGFEGDSPSTVVRFIALPTANLKLRNTAWGRWTHIRELHLSMLSPVVVPAPKDLIFKPSKTYEMRFLSSSLSVNALRSMIGKMGFNISVGPLLYRRMIRHPAMPGTELTDWFMTGTCNRPRPAILRGGALGPLLIEQVAEL